MVSQQVYNELKTSHSGCAASIVELGRTDETRQSRVTELEIAVSSMVSREEFTRLENSLKTLQAEHS